MSSGHSPFDEEGDKDDIECLRSSSSTVWHGGIQAVCMPDPVNITSVTRPFVSK